MSLELALDLLFIGLYQVSRVIIMPVDIKYFHYSLLHSARVAFFNASTPRRFP